MSVEGAGNEQIAIGATLDEFLTAFLGQLASPKFSTSGNLNDYLATPSEQRSGDEASIVDMRITASLIKTLGYTDHEFEYNAQAGKQRPDFVISIKEYPRQACFIVEDKNTTELELRIHRPQLQGYMTQFGASRGMLVNGHAVLVYDQMEGGVRTPAIEIPLGDAVAAWLGDSLFVEGKSGISALESCGFIALFAALWRRFRRESFSGLPNLIDDLTLQNDKGHNQPHQTNGKTWTNTYCRIPILPVNNENADQLTDAIKGLIAEFEDDADAQLAAIETEYNVYLAASMQIPSETTTLQHQEDRLVEDALQLMAGADKESKEYDDGLLRKIMRGEVLTGELKQIERRLYSLHPIKAGRGTDRDPIFTLLSRVRAFTDKRYRYLSKLQAQHRESIKVCSYIETWKEKTAAVVFQSDNAGLLRREFLAQTAYLVIIRILLVRIMEDKGLVNRMFTNGGLALWFRQVESHYLAHAMGRSANFLLELAYTSAQHVYAHFFAERTVLDWYTPDRNAVVRVLHTLAGFNLRDINRDIIGAVYNQYVEAKHKHESGMYFTPPEVVSFMLDRIGYKGTGIIGKRLIDLSCGSGGFLVEAGTRLVTAHRDYWKALGHANVPAEKVQFVLDEIRDSLHGIDLNPFACALAETNLLIQVIDLFSVAHKGKQPATIERFHIYNSDSLSFSADTLASQAGTLPFPDDDLPVEDQMKAGIGKWRCKFDYVVGNPPYVRADENEAVRSYRDRIKREYPSPSVRATMVQKWDLFVPFVSASLNLLKRETEHGQAGKMAIITSSAIETVPYCEPLRHLLATEATVEEVHFFPSVKLFADAAVRNTITIVNNRPPGTHASSTRFWHDTAPKWGSLSQALKQTLKISQFGTKLFRQLLPSIKFRDGIETVPLAEICYISKGMVLHANEKTHKGQFVLDDLLSKKKVGSHVTPYVGGKDLGEYGCLSLKYIEYGPGYRVPSQVSRPTFPELYDRPKILMARFGGIMYDDGPTEFLKCNHTVMILMPWSSLRGVKNKSISSQLGPREVVRSAVEDRSERFDPWYLLAFLNSQQVLAMLASVSSSAINGEIQPDDLRQISVPIPDDEGVTKTISELAQKASRFQKEMLPLRLAGWLIGDDRTVAPAIIPIGIPTLSLDGARVVWGLVITEPAAKVRKLIRSGHRLFLGKQQVAHIAASAPEEAIEWLRRQLLTFPEGTTLGEVDALNPQIPSTPALAKQALSLLILEEQRVKNLQEQIDIAKTQISAALETLFERISLPPIK
ncbi:class I SAM-dependent DNA methyltransferase [Burkholderia sp. S171]|uniref:HsdM family class I SAM-dependent methyltransferase n=1 Tax=Burkholderia sp. S171 TaxID=1641860 RepID=UPI00131C09C4|nr:N-6 DNA methylase [Burkholderia sp. S171]